MGVLFSIILIGLVFGAWMLILLFVVLRRRRQWQAAVAVLSYLDIALRMKLSIPEVMYAGMADESGLARRRIERVANAIGAGQPVGLAIGDRLPELDDRSARLIAHAEHTGDLGDTLRQLVTQARTATRRWDAQQLVIWGYVFGLAMITVSMTTGQITFVMPKLAEIAQDFDTDLPWATRLMYLDPNHAMMLMGGIGLLALGLLLAAFLLSFVLKRRTTGRMADRLIGLAWWLPPLSWAVRDRAMADLFAALSSSVRLGLPMHTAIRDAARVMRWGAYRRRVSRWARAVSEGVEPDRAAHAAGLPRFVVGALALGRTGRLDAGLFEYLANHYANRFSRLSAMIRGALVPIAVLLIGSVVGFVCYAMFAPIVHVLEAVLESSDGWAADA